MDMNLHEIDMPSKPALATVLPKSAGKAERLEEWAANVGNRTISLLGVASKAKQVWRFYINKGQGFKRIGTKELRGAKIAFPHHSCFVTKASKTHIRNFMRLSK